MQHQGIMPSNMNDMNLLIQSCTVFRRLFIMYGLLSLLMLFLGIDALAAGNSNTVYSKTLLGLYILQAISYLFVSLFFYPLGQWVNVISFTKSQIKKTSICVIFAVILIIVRTAVDLSYCSKFKNSTGDDDVYTDNESVDTAIAWIVISFLLIMLFNCITVRFIYIFYNQLEHFQDISRNHPMVTNQDFTLGVQRPIMTQAYVSNSPFAHQTTMQGKVISVSEPTQTTGQVINSPMAVPINNAHTITTVTAHTV